MRSLINLPNLGMTENGLGGLLLTCDGAGVHSVPSFSKDAGSTNYFMVL